MIELLYSFLITFIIIFPTFFIFNSFKIPKFYINYYQYNCFILFVIKKIFFSSNIIGKYELIHEVPFNPIINITILNITEPNSINLEFLNDRTYSLVKQGKYSRECLSNYYIDEFHECPITDIILENNKSFIHEGYIELKLSNGKYLYYTNKNKSGLLYEEISDSLNDNNTFEMKYNFYTSEKFREIKLEEDSKFSNPFVKYNYFTRYSHCFLAVASIFFSSYVFVEIDNPRLFDSFKIISHISELIAFILQLKGLILLEKVRPFSFNKNYYESPQDYRKLFKVDCFMLSIQICKIIMEILYIIFPRKWQITHCCDIQFISQEYAHTLNNQMIESRMFTLFYPVYLSFILVFFIDICNENQINKRFEYLDYNWKTNPIISIEISQNPDYEIGKISTTKEDYKLYEWKNTYLKIKRLSDFNYYNIYTKENGKLCGKDSFGNNLYFPEDIECPVNDIIITTNSYLEGYNKLSLGDNHTYLYYTNKNVNKSIIIDIRANYKNSNYTMQLNLEKTNDLCETLFFPNLECKKNYEFNSNPFYEKIDEWNSEYFIEKQIKRNTYGNIINLNSISYLGINSDINNKRKIISDFTKKMNIYDKVIIFKKMPFIITIIAIIVFIYFLLFDGPDTKFQIVNSLFFLIFLFAIVIIYSISLYINIIYIKNFMEKFISVYSIYRKEYIFSITIWIYEIIIFLSLLKIYRYTNWL